MKRAIFCGVTIALAALAHALIGHHLAAHDVALSILSGSRAATLALVLSLLVTRLFLYLLAPGWVLYTLVMLAWARFAKPRR